MGEKIGFGKDAIYWPCMHSLLSPWPSKISKNGILILPSRLKPQVLLKCMVHSAALPLLQEKKRSRRMRITH